MSILDSSGNLTNFPKDDAGSRSPDPVARCGLCKYWHVESVQTAVMVRTPSGMQPMLEEQHKQLSKQMVSQGMKAPPVEKRFRVAPCVARTFFMFQCDHIKPSKGKSRR